MTQTIFSAVPPRENNRASPLVGISVSTESWPWNMWCSRWYFLKATLKGMPIGRLASSPNARFAPGDANARLCESSWFARKRFAVAKPPNRYAHSSITGVLA